MNMSAVEQVAEVGHMPSEQLSKDVAYTLNWEVTPALIQLWMEASRCNFIGTGQDGVSPLEAHNQLLQIKDTQAYCGRPRLGILGIWYKGKQVGFSVPRKMVSGDSIKYAFDPTKEYYRMGRIYVTKKYRNRGIATEIVRQFMAAHPYLVWEHKEHNYASQAVARALGLTKRHTIYHDHKGSWYLTPIDRCLKVTVAWASGIGEDYISLNKPRLINQRRSGESA